MMGVQMGDFDRMSSAIKLGDVLLANEVKHVEELKAEVERLSKRCKELEEQREFLREVLTEEDWKFWAKKWLRRK